MAKRITYKKLSETALRKITEDPTDVWNYMVGGNKEDQYKLFLEMHSRNMRQLSLE